MDIIKMNKKSYERIASDYAKEQEGIITPTFRYFCQQLPITSRVLDIGSGTGIPHAKYLLNQGFQVEGIDFSEEMVKISRKNVPEAKFRVLSMTEMNYNQEFDGAIACASMLHLNQAQFQKVAERIVLALRPRSWFYLSLFEQVSGEDELLEEVNTESKFSTNWGVPMYSRAYSKNEVLDVFTPLQMQLQQFHRETVFTKLYGEEHKTEFIFQLVNES